MSAAICFLGGYFIGIGAFYRVWSIAIAGLLIAAIGLGLL